MNLQEIQEAGRTAWQSLSTHKLRSFLTTLGIIVGVGTVVAIVSIIHGLNTSMTRQIESLGTDVVFVRAAPPADGRPGAARSGRPVTERDAQWIERSCRHVSKVAPFRSTRDRVEAGSRKTGYIQILGVTPDYGDVNKYEVDRGRFLSEMDAERGRAVCVLGRTVEEGLFRGRSALGEHVFFQGRRLLVVGVLREKGRFITNDLDEIVLVPLRMFERIRGTGQSLRINIMPTSTEALPLAVDEIRHALRRRRGLEPGEPEDFDVVTQASLMDTYRDITRIGYWVIRVVASISLLVGGIGIMNIMLVTVTERTREIGIRKALGARSRDVLFQFLVEALALRVLGGGVGLGVGALLGGVVKLATPLPAAVPPWALGLAFGVCTGVGLFFGVFPATRAARLNPVEALRHE